MVESRGDFAAEHATLTAKDSVPSALHRLIMTNQLHLFSVNAWSSAWFGWKVEAAQRNCGLLIQHQQHGIQSSLCYSVDT